MVWKNKKLESFWRSNIEEVQKNRTDPQQHKESCING
jgi:hypothetical protein